MYKDLFKFALKYFYPKNHQTIDGVEYNSKKEMYEEWFDSTYLNGAWYIADEIPSVVATLTRSVDDTFYMITGDARYHLGFGMFEFTSTQTINISLQATIDGDNETYSYTAKLFEKNKNYVYVPLDEEITPSNINKIVLQAEATVENNIKYSMVNEVFYNPYIMRVSKEEYDFIRQQ